MTDLATIADAVDALTNPIRVRERIEVWDKNRNKKIRWHDHTAKPLLEQLHKAMIPGEAYVEDGSGRVKRRPRSIPPARLEAISASLMIDAGAMIWVIRVGLDLRDTTPSNLRALVGAQTDSDIEAAILRDLRRWYGWAATLSGWERPPWKPDAPCPLCDENGTLRVYLARKTATCVACHESWSEAAGTIGLLAQHVENLAQRDRTLSGAAIAFAALRVDAARRRQELIQAANEPAPDLPYAGV